MLAKTTKLFSTYEVAHFLGERNAWVLDKVETWPDIGWKIEGHIILSRRDIHRLLWLQSRPDYKGPAPWPYVDKQKRMRLWSIQEVADLFGVSLYVIRRINEKNKGHIGIYVDDLWVYTKRCMDRIKLFRQTDGRELYPWDGKIYLDPDIKDVKLDDKVLLAYDNIIRNSTTGGRENG